MTMVNIKSKAIVSLVGGFIVLFFLLPIVDSSREVPESTREGQKISQSNPLKLMPRLATQIRVHAFLLWSSVGFLVPTGILLIRMPTKVYSGKRFKLFFYSHLVAQITAVLLATAGAVLSLTNFENSFNNCHQRMGLALYALMWFQPLVAYFRPQRGAKVRRSWYFLHWMFGNGICVLGIANIYIGLHNYHQRTSRSVRLWIILFTVEVSILAFVYLLQDRWEYIKKQGEDLGDEKATQTNDTIAFNKSQKETKVVSNSLAEIMKRAP